VEKEEERGRGRMRNFRSREKGRKEEGEVVTAPEAEIGTEGVETRLSGSEITCKRRLGSDVFVFSKK